MPNQPTDNEIWPAGLTADASKLLEATESLIADAVADPNVRTNSLRDSLLKELGPEFLTRDGQLKPGPSWVAQNIPTISKLSKEPVKWIIDQFIPYGSITMFAGAGGSMKSWLMMAAAQRISSRLAGYDDGSTSPTFLGRKVLYGVPVLYVDRENQEGEVGRRAGMLGILGNANFHYWVEGSNATPSIDHDALLEFATKEKGLIIFDSLQDWYGDADENNNSQMAKLIGQLRTLARAGAGVIFIHHLNAAGERARGGTTITNLTDMAFNVSKDRASGIVKIKEERFRMCGSWEMAVKPNWSRYPGKLVWELISDKGEALLQKENVEQEGEEIAAVVRAVDQFPKLSAPTLIQKEEVKTILGGKGMGLAKFERLAARGHRKYDKDSKCWIATGAEQNNDFESGEVY